MCHWCPNGPSGAARPGAGGHQESAAGALDGLGKVAAAHLTGAGTAHIDTLNELVHLI
jgi:hypothetical protein